MLENKLWLINRRSQQRNTLLGLHSQRNGPQRLGAQGNSLLQKD